MNAVTTDWKRKSNSCLNIFVRGSLEEHRQVVRLFLLRPRSGAARADHLRDGLAAGALTKNKPAKHSGRPGKPGWPFVLKAFSFFGGGQANPLHWPIQMQSSDFHHRWDRQCLLCSSRVRSGFLVVMCGPQYVLARCGRANPQFVPSWVKASEDWRFPSALQDRRNSVRVRGGEPWKNSGADFAANDKAA